MVVCPCFVPGEEAGVTFTAPANHYPLEIITVDIGWGSQFGGSGASLEQAINLYSGALPNPGAPQWSLAGPQLTDGFVNQFDISGTPGNRVVQSGPFTVTLEFANASTLFGPSMIHDGLGCTPASNVVKAVPGGWSDACALGVTGNWIFTVEYRRLNCGIGSSICSPGVPNSTGMPGMIRAEGSVMVADQDLTLVAESLPPNQFGFFLTSLSQGVTMNPGGSQGRLCLTGNIGRYDAQIFNSGALGSTSLVVDMQSLPTFPTQAIFAGQQWYFQAWHRDVNPTATSNFTEAVGVMFQ